MVWLKFTDDYTGDPDIIGLSDSAFRAWHEAIAYSEQRLLDGFVPTSFLRRFRGRDECVRKGLLSITEGGFNIRNFLKYQMSKAAVEALREGKHEIKVRAGKLGAAKRWQKDSRAVAEHIAEPKQTDSRAVADAWQKDSPVPVSRIPIPVPSETQGLKTSTATAREESAFWMAFSKAWGENGKVMTPTYADDLKDWERRFELKWHILPSAIMATHSVQETVRAAAQFKFTIAVLNRMLDSGNVEKPTIRSNGNGQHPEQQPLTGAYAGDATAQRILAAQRDAAANRAAAQGNGLHGNVVRPEGGGGGSGAQGALPGTIGPVVA